MTAIVYGVPGTETQTIMAETIRVWEQVILDGASSSASQRKATP